ncbi:MAG: YceI family protein [Alphaproteobacteria bacterium]|nr:YceI family protein [Alphaproteobacteria bacterium]
MRKLIPTFLLSLAFAQPALADAYSVDDDHSAVLFSVQHFGAAWVYGRFDKISGDFDWSADVSKSTFSLTIDAASVDSDQEKRDQHLAGPDFFNAAEFPTITFKSKKVEKKGDKLLHVTGDLTLRGVTKEVTIPIEHTGEGDDPWGGHRAGLHSTFTIKRSDFGITYMPDGLSDQVKLIVSLEGVKK